MVLLFFWSGQAMSAAWEGYGRSMPKPRYEQDEGAHARFTPAASLEAFAPYKDPPLAEALSLPNPLKEADFQSYQLIIVVNKHAHPFWGAAQTLRVYKRGQGLIRYWLISTGGKGFETPAGYFTPQGFSSRHWSSRYDAPMLWAVFFNSGISLHSSLDRDALKDMGRAATSHGCVRIEDHRAEDLYHLIGHSGYGTVDRLDRNGRVLKKNGKTLKAQGYRTLIIVAPAQLWDAAPVTKLAVKTNAKKTPETPKPGKTVRASKTKPGARGLADAKPKSNPARKQKARS